MADFVCETREMLQALECELVAWEIDPNDRPRLDSIFRFVHTVKGNCGFLDLPKLQTLSHSVEDALNEVRSGQRATDRALVDAVLAVIDRIGAMVDALDAGDDPSDAGNAALIAALAKPAEGLGPIPMPKAEIGRASVSNSAGVRSIRLPVQLVDRMMSGVSDMVLVRNEMERMLRDRLDDPQLEGAFGRMSGLLAEMRVAVAEARMQPVAALFLSFQRQIRDLSSELGKQVLVEIESGQVDLDRELVELIRDPLLHIINNAIDHGIEPSSVRASQGKSATATIMMSARQTGSEVRIAIIDDGRGIDVDKIVEKAIGLGILSGEDAREISPEQRNALIFEPGLSTADNVTRISGRGVGMDIVREAIERLGGSIAVETELGQGCRVILTVPLTLSIVPVITVRVGVQVFAIPRSYVLEIVRGGAEVESGAIGGVRQVVVREVQYSCIGLGEALGLSDGAPALEQTMLMLKMITGRVVALGVDGIEGHSELVVKPIAQQLTPSKLFVGAAQLDDGYPALVIDVAALAREVVIVEHGSRDFANRVAGYERSSQATAPAQLLVFDTWAGNRVGIALAAAERIVKIDPATIRSGPNTMHALVGGIVTPLAGTECGSMPSVPFQALLLGDGETSLAYVAAGTIDTAELPVEELVGNAAVAIDGRIVNVLDCHALFAQYGKPARNLKNLSCRLPTADRWCNDFLRPLVEASGYQVIEDDSAAADLEIRMSDVPGEPRGPAGVILTLCEHRHGTTSGSIHRYDRDAIIEALAATRVAGQ